jgi:hypothetical protein
MALSVTSASKPSGDNALIASIHSEAFVIPIMTFLSIGCAMIAVNKKIFFLFYTKNRLMQPYFAAPPRPWRILCKTLILSCKVRSTPDSFTK